MIDLSTLNDAQRTAVMTKNGPMLIIAGAGSGKTRTIVHRLAHLTEHGVSAYEMLLLTFTKKAALEMLHRASTLLNEGLSGIEGGTFHAFAFRILRQFPPEWAKNSLTILDTGDSASILSHCKDLKKIGKGDRSFPKNQTILGIFSKARNKELSLEEILRRETQHLLAHLEPLQELESMYANYRREHLVLDYDDLLFELEHSLKTNDQLFQYINTRFKHLMVDEYQDTNMVQARLVRLLSSQADSVMAVGDDAQSIYAFRGANIQNILDFPKLFENTKIIRLEENYRSVQPILHIANAVLENAPTGFQKHLFSHREYDEITSHVFVYRPMSDISQARLVAKKVSDLLQRVNPLEIAVLFRAGYHSYHVEVELNKLGIGFRKFGGVRYTEASHIKDVLAFARLVINPLDLPAFERIASLCKGVGPKTAHKLFSLATQGDETSLRKACIKYEDFWKDLQMLAEIKSRPSKAERIIREIIDHYQPRMEWLYPDDWPRRQQGLEELIGIANSYEDLSLFMADLALENPKEDDEDEDRRITLSTVHSAKGLEWQHVIILDLVEDRFPSKHALTRSEDYEEERRLLYVACTRAKDSLSLFVPQNLYQRGRGFEERATPSPFVREIPSYLYEEVFEQYGGILVKKAPQSAMQQRKSELHINEKSNENSYKKNSIQARSPQNTRAQENISELQEVERVFTKPARAPYELGFCSHRIFGRGKIIEEIDTDKVRVNFPGLGLKVIIKTYLTYD